MNDPLIDATWWFYADEALKDPFVLFCFILFISSFFALLIITVWVSRRSLKK